MWISELKVFDVRSPSNGVLRLFHCRLEVGTLGLDRRNTYSIAVFFTSAARFLNNNLNKWCCKLYKLDMSKFFCSCFLLADSSEKITLAGDVAISCLKIAISRFHDKNDNIKKLSAMTFPLVLVLPKVSLFYLFFVVFLSLQFLKLPYCHESSIANCFVVDSDCLCNPAQTQKTNLKVLELAKEQKLSFYQNLPVVSSEGKVNILLVVLKMIIFWEYFIWSRDRN